jgi:hypothetical protein
MLIHKDWQGRLVLGQHPADLLEEVPPGVLVPPPLVVRVVAVLADQQHRVHRQAAL